MKIAVSGAHYTGKTTLIDALCQALPNYASLEEPYYLLEQEGHLFPEKPGIEDFEAQLAYSIELITSSKDNIIFDRCPADFLAYLSTHDDSGSFDVKSWLPQIERTLAYLDLIIFVPIEEPDVIDCPEWEDLNFRKRVDESLHDMTVDDSWGFQLEVIEVNGSVHDRVIQILNYISY